MYFIILMIIAFRFNFLDDESLACSSVNRRSQYLAHKIAGSFRPVARNETKRNGIRTKRNLAFFLIFGGVLHTAAKYRKKCLSLSLEHFLRCWRNYGPRGSYFLSTWFLKCFPGCTVFPPLVCEVLCWRVMWLLGTFVLLIERSRQ